MRDQSVRGPLSSGGNDHTKCVLAIPEFRGNMYNRRPQMNLWRKIGIGIVSIIPAFVLGGLIWNMSHSWLSVFATIVIVGLFSGSAIAGKFSSPEQSAHH